VIASVDTYLRFAEAVNRLDLQPSQEAIGLPGLVNQLQESGARSKTRGALSGAGEKARDVMQSLTGRGRDEDDEDENQDRDEEDGGRGDGRREDRGVPASRRAPRRS
jgi:hypothetical protein